MNKGQKKKSLIDELKTDYRKAREKRDFIAMREIYIELWKREIDSSPDRCREEFVFFAEILDDNSVVLPYELSDFFGKICCISVLDEWIDISLSNEYSELAEEHMKEESLEFTKTILQDRLELSSIALESLKVKSGDILRIEYDLDGCGETLQLYNENDGLRFKLKTEVQNKK